MISKASRTDIRQKKHRRIRHHLKGTAQAPRLAVFRSNKHMYAQIIDDTVGKTLVSASTLQKDVKAELEYTDNVAAAAHRESLRWFTTEAAISITVKSKHSLTQQEKLDLNSKRGRNGTHET